MWGGLAAESHTVTDALAALDPTTPDLLVRDIELIWQARAATAFMTNDPDGIQRATAWLQEGEPRCGNTITEAWILSNIVAAAGSAPDALIVRPCAPTRREQPKSERPGDRRLLHAHSVSPTRRPGDQLEVDDSLADLQQAIACSRGAGNLFVEATCMGLAANPLTRRGERSDAAALQATLARIGEVRYDFALTFLAARLAVWFALLDRPETASVIDGWFRTHLNAPYPIQYQSDHRATRPTVGHRGVPRGAGRGATMTTTELIDYLDDQLATIATDDTVSTS